MLATYINAIAVIIGSLLGLMLKKIINERFKTIIFQGAALASMTMGIIMVIKGKNIILVIFSIIIGGILGEILRIEYRLNNVGEWLKKKFSKHNESSFTRGFVLSSTTFLVGAMTIIGAINASAGSYDVLLTKSIMDGSISIVFASVLGFGVIFSSVSILVYQGALTLLASSLIFLKNPVYLNDISATGGILVFAIGINLLEIKRIRVANFLPGIFLIILAIFIKIKLGF